MSNQQRDGDTVVVDTETLATDKRALVLTLSAVRFSRYAVELGLSFDSGEPFMDGETTLHLKLNVTEQLLAGRTVDPGTVKWLGPASSTATQYRPARRLPCFQDLSRKRSCSPEVLILISPSWQACLRTSVCRCLGALTGCAMCGLTSMRCPVAPRDTWKTGRLRIGSFPTTRSMTASEMQCRCSKLGGAQSHQPCSRKCASWSAVTSVVCHCAPSGRQAKRGSYCTSN